MVVRGFRQIKGVDYTCTYSPTIEIDSFGLTIAIALIYKWNLGQIGIKTSYLNAYLDEKIYIQIPIGDKNFNCGKSWLLQKALPRFKQAGRQWFYKFSNFLKIFGLIQYNTDNCLLGKYKIINYTREPWINATLEDRENYRIVNKTDYKRLIGSLIYVSIINERKFKELIMM